MAVSEGREIVSTPHGGLATFLVHHKTVKDILTGFNSTRWISNVQGLMYMLLHQALVSTPHGGLATDTPSKAKAKRVLRFNSTRWISNFLYLAEPLSGMAKFQLHTVD